MTSQGSAYGRFRRSLDRRLVVPALEAAGELERVTLADALELCELLAQADDDRFAPAARRWLIRFLEEVRPSIGEALIASAALSELAARPDSPVALETLGQLVEPG